ncbi:MAG: InlB B-repeat-containing protein [Bacteroides sp.]|nr:InlB B-repeat-containing protein [Bacteroides sp.]
MKVIYKRIAAAVAAIAVMITATVFDVPEKIAAAAEETHSHKVCSNGLTGATEHDGCAHEAVEYEPFPYDSQPLGQVSFKSGNYYLTRDITLSDNGRILIGPGTVNICLNGHDIKKSDGQIIDINSNFDNAAALNVCDCKGYGHIENTGGSNRYSAVSVMDKSEFNLYGGHIYTKSNGYGIDIHNTTSDDSGSANIYGGSVNTEAGACVYIQDANSVFNLYGGSLNSSDYYAVYAENGKALIKGGSVKASGSKDTIYINGENAEVTVSGGTVTGENCEAIYCYYGTLNVSGGTVKSNDSDSYAVYNYDRFNLSGGTVSDINNRNGYTMNIIGGDITLDGTIYNRGTLNITDGKITANGTYAVSNYNNAEVTISGGKIYAKKYLLYNQSGGNARISGGDLLSDENVCLWNNGVLDITDGKLASLNYSTYVMNNGTLNISGGVFDSSSPYGYVQNKSVLNLSGSPQFDYVALWLRSDDNITISGALAYDKPIAVYLDSGTPRTLTSGWSTYMSGNDPSEYFKSPYINCLVEENDNEAYMRRFKVIPDANGGKCTTLLKYVDSYAKLDSLPEATREGYTLDGWFTAKEGGERVTVDTVFTSDAVIYAHWTEIVCDHKWSSDWSKDDTDHWHECINGCGVKGGKAEHEWNDGEIIQQPTEEEKGVMTYTCRVCGKEKTDDIDALGHTHGYSTEWTSDENTHWHAATCGRDVRSGEAEHDFGEPTVTPSTCTQQGSEKYACQTCGYEKTIALDLAEHSFGDWQKDDNSHWRVCTVCNTERSEEAAHSWDSGSISKEPTENEAGVMTYTCTVCNADKTEPIAPLGHTHDWSADWSKDDSEHWHECLKGCGEKNDKAAHAWNDGEITKLPSDDTEGEKTFECTVCGQIKTETVPTTGGENNDGSISVEVQPGANAPKTQLITSDEELIKAVLTDEEQELVKNGVDIKIILTVDDAAETVSPADKSLIETAISGLTNYKLGQYLDVNLLKIIGDSQANITETNAPITVRLEIPAALRGKQIYSVIRVHGGEADVLTDEDNDADFITIKTDRFSTYALAYSETAGGTPSGGNTDDNKPDPPVTGGFIDPMPPASDENEPAPPIEDGGGDGPAPTESKPNESGNVYYEDGGGSSDGETAQSRDECPSTDESGAGENDGSQSGGEIDPASSESAPNGGEKNPATGIALSCLPLAAPIVVVTAAAKRKKK